MKQFVRIGSVLFLALVLLVPGSLGAQAQINEQANPEVVAAVQDSPEFARTLAENPDVRPARWAVRTFQVNDAAVAIHALKSQDSRTTVTVTHFVNMATGAVKAGIQVRLEVLTDTAGAVQRHFPGESAAKVAEVTLSSSKGVSFSGWVTDTGLIQPKDEAYADRAAAARTNAQDCEDCQPSTKFDEADFGKAIQLEQQGEMGALGWCEDIMNLLCAASGAGICFFTCAGLGATPAGLGCAVLCGLIATLGCANTTDLVCG
jgi:hypothetical protein